MHLGVPRLVAVAALAIPIGVGSCVSQPEPPRWHCWFDDDPAVCRCYFTTDDEITTAGYTASEFWREECPVADYLCCEDGRSPERIEGDACACANPASVIYCRGDYPIVSRCP